MVQSVFHCWTPTQITCCWFRRAFQGKWKHLINGRIKTAFFSIKAINTWWTVSLELSKMVWKNKTKNQLVHSDWTLMPHLIICEKRHKHGEILSVSIWKPCGKAAKMRGETERNKGQSLQIWPVFIWGTLHLLAMEASGLLSLLIPFKPQQHQWGPSAPL